MLKPKILRPKMLKPKINWADKTAVITGSGSGIGRAVAIALIKKGASVTKGVIAFGIIWSKKTRVRVAPNEMAAIAKS